METKETPDKLSILGFAEVTRKKNQLRTGIHLLLFHLRTAVRGVFSDRKKKTRVHMGSLMAQGQQAKKMRKLQSNKSNKPSIPASTKAVSNSTSSAEAVNSLTSAVEVTKCGGTRLAKGETWSHKNPENQELEGEDG